MLSNEFCHIVDGSLKVRLADLGIIQTSLNDIAVKPKLNKVRLSCFGGHDSMCDVDSIWHVAQARGLIFAESDWALVIQDVWHAKGPLLSDAADAVVDAMHEPDDVDVPELANAVADAMPELANASNELANAGDGAMLELADAPVAELRRKLIQKTTALRLSRHHLLPRLLFLFCVCIIAAFPVTTVGVRQRVRRLDAKVLAQQRIIGKQQEELATLKSTHELKKKSGRYFSAVGGLKLAATMANSLTSSVQASTLARSDCSHPTASRWQVLVFF